MNVKRPTFLFIFFIFMVSLSSAANADNTTAVVAIDDATKVVNATWDSQGVTMVFESNIPRMASITDVNSIPDSGAGQVNFKQVRLSTGQTEVRMNTEQKQGSMAVTIGVGDSLVALSNPTKPLITDVGRADVYLSMFLVAILTPINVLAAIWWEKIGLSRRLIRVG